MSLWNGGVTVQQGGHSGRRLTSKGSHMKKLIMAAIAVVSLCLSNAASASEVVITTSQQA